MANLIVDIGNTALKAAWADGITLGKTFRYQGERMLDFILSLTEKEKADAIRTNDLRQMGLKVIRICNLDIDRNFRGVCEFIDESVRKSLPQSALLTAPSSEGAK